MAFRFYMEDGSSIVLDYGGACIDIISAWKNEYGDNEESVALARQIRYYSEGEHYAYFWHPNRHIWVPIEEEHKELTLEDAIKEAKIIKARLELEEKLEADSKRPKTTREIFIENVDRFFDHWNDI